MDYGSIRDVGRRIAGAATRMYDAVRPGKKLEALGRQNAALNNQIRALNQLVADEKTNLSSATEDYRLVQTQYQKLSGLYETANKSLEASTLRVEDLQRQNTAITAQAGELEKSVGYLTTSLHTVQAALQGKDAEVAAAKKQAAYALGIYKHHLGRGRKMRETVEQLRDNYIQHFVKMVQTLPGFGKGKYVIIDHHENIVYASGKIRELLGYNGHASGQSYLDLIRGDKDQLRKIFRDPNPKPTSLTVETSKGPAIVTTKVTHLYAEINDPFATNEDLTNKKKMKLHVGTTAIIDTPGRFMRWATRVLKHQAKDAEVDRAAHVAEQTANNSTLQIIPKPPTT